MPPIEDLLKLKNNVSIPAPTQAQPNYNSSQFSGGGYQVGDAAKQIGPTDDEAMYGALADMAGGVKKSIEIFTDIRSQMEKSEIEKAKLKYKSILGGDYDEKIGPDGAKVKTYKNPAAKLAEWDEYTRDIWTPLLGSNWLEDTNLDAYAAFGNREAQDAFEKGRYIREWTDYREKYPTRNPNSLDFKQDFDRAYVSKFKSASSNGWFRETALFNQGAVYSRAEDEAIRGLDLSISLEFPIPNEEELKIINSLSPEGFALKEKFKDFFKAVENGSFMNDDNALRDHLMKRFTSTIENIDEYAPNVQEALARILKEKVKEYTTLVKDAMIPARIAQRKEIATAAIATASTNLLSGYNTQRYTMEFLDSQLKYFADTGITKTESKAILNSMLGDIMGSWHNSATVGGEASILTENPNWKNLSPNKQLDLVKKYVNDYLDSSSLPGGPTLRKELSRVFQIDENQFNTYMSSSASYLLSPEHNQAVLAYQARQQISSNQDVKTIQLLETEDAVKNKTNDSLSSIASNLGVTNASVRAYFIQIDEDGNESFTTYRNPDEWFNSLSSVEKEELIARGFTKSSYATLIKELDMAESIEKIALDQIKRIQSGDKSIAKAREDANDKIASGLGQLSTASDPSAIESSGNIREGIISGRLHGKDTESTKPATDALVLSSLYYKAYQSIPSSFLDPKTGIVINREGLSKEQLDSVDFMNNEFPFLFEIPGFEEKFNTMQAMRYEMEGKLPFLASLSPKYSQPGADINELQESLDSAIFNIFTGKASLFDGRLPQNTFDPKKGDFTAAGYTFLLQASMVGNELIGSRDLAVNKKYGEIMNNFLTTLGNVKDPNQIFNNKDNMILLLAVNLLSKSFKQEYDKNPFKKPSNADFAFSYYMLLANSAEEVSLPDLVKVFASPQGRANLTTAQAFPIMLAHAIVNNQGEVIMANKDMGGIRYMQTIPQYQVRVATMATLFQLDPQFTEEVNIAIQNNTSVDIMNKGVSPSDPTWSADNFLKTWIENRFLEEDMTMEQLARVMRASLLEGSLMPGYEPSAEETVRMGAMIIAKIAGEDIRKLSIPLEIYNGPAGISNPAFDPYGRIGVNQAQTKAEFLFGIIGMGLDIDTLTRSYTRVEGATTNNSSGFNRDVVQVGVNKFEFQYTITSGNKNLSSSTSNIGSLAQAAFGESFGVIDTNLVLQDKLAEQEWQKADKVAYEAYTNSGSDRAYVPPYLPKRKAPDLASTLASKYPPLLYKGEPEDGIPYQASVAVLQSKPTKEILEALLFNWLEDNSPSYESSSRFTTIPAYVPPLRIPRRGLGADAIYKVMENPPETVDAALRLVADVYDGYKDKKGSKGSNFIDRQKYNQPIGRANPIQVLDGDNTVNFLPTFDWSIRTLSGAPFITINDEVLRLAEDYWRKK